ncbi:hypothetical protein B0T26DRAFT_414240 [Lasiosphaeria miniovina]|uniref:Uncharacterized protein n=1 Tax=Lasiosphaeria miniovina TaxID=1954250 RepID=A0AA40A5G6_9PEZI|nr:uncharacterized protein B0T26DRAFT_414240 [Lasiosphaeria miniovina]KAK0709617.1 hypothetical protein B0T26DRAFT_414240 [Lasiosphaeria miniovina]
MTAPQAAGIRIRIRSGLDLLALVSHQTPGFNLPPASWAVRSQPQRATRAQSHMPSDISAAPLASAGYNVGRISFERLQIGTEYKPILLRGRLSNHTQINPYPLHPLEDRQHHGGGKDLFLFRAGSPRCREIPDIELSKMGNLAGPEWLAGGLALSQTSRSETTLWFSCFLRGGLEHDMSLSLPARVPPAPALPVCPYLEVERSGPVSKVKDEGGRPQGIRDKAACCHGLETNRHHNASARWPIRRPGRPYKYVTLKGNKVRQPLSRSGKEAMCGLGSVYKRSEGGVLLLLCMTDAQARIVGVV